MRLLDKAREVASNIKSARDRGLPVVGTPDRPGAYTLRFHVNQVDEMNEDITPGSEYGSWRHGRAYVYLGMTTNIPICQVSVQWCLFGEATLCCTSLSVFENKVESVFSIPKVCSLFATIDTNHWFGDHMLDVFDLTHHDNTVWWRILSPATEWKTSAPLWRDGHFDYLNTLFGKPKMREERLYTRSTEIPLPEGSYPANITITQRTWVRARIPMQFASSLFAHVDVPDGIPVPKRSEDGWEVINGSFSGGGYPVSPHNPVADAIAKTVQHVFAQRNRYGSGVDDTGRKIVEA